MAQNPFETQFDMYNPLMKAMRVAKLSSAQRILLLGIHHHYQDRCSLEPVFVSFAELSETTGLSKEAIRQNRKKLLELGWLTFVQGNKAQKIANQYQLNFQKIAELSGYELQLRIKQPKNYQYQIDNNQMDMVNGIQYQTPALAMEARAKLRKGL